VQVDVELKASRGKDVADCAVARVAVQYDRFVEENFFANFLNQNWVRYSPKLTPSCRGEGILKQFLILSLAIAVNACVTTSPEKMNEVLNDGYFYVSENLVDSMEEFNPTNPVVVFLHGCSGFNSRQFRVMRTISFENYDIVAPNSFSRAENRVKCKGDSSSMLYRNEDINFALNFIRRKTNKPIFLVGFSEGGRAVAEYRGRVKIKGKIILGYDCYHGVNENVPVLNVVGSYDNETGRLGSICNVENKYFSDSGHDVSTDKTVKPLLDKFMKDILLRKG